MIAEPSLETFKAILGRRGTISYEAPHDDSAGNVVPLYEYTWNHTTLQWLKQDRTITYSAVPVSGRPRDRSGPRDVGAVSRRGACRTPSSSASAGASPAVRCRSCAIVGAERLNEIIALHEKHGVMIANPHVYTLEDGSRHKRADADQLGFKGEVDPSGCSIPARCGATFRCAH